MPATVELDPRNRDFAWPQREAPPRFLTAEQVAAFDRDGFVVLEQVLDHERLAAVEAELDRFNAEREEQLRAAGGSERISRADEFVVNSNLVARSDNLRRFVSAQPFPGLLADLIGPDVRYDWDQLVYKKPETPRDFPWHQDTGYAFAEPQWGSLTCWIPLVDATVENGCIWVVPGAHRQGTFRHWQTELGWVCKEDDCGGVPVEAKAGDVIVFSTLTPHKSGPNVSEGTRKAYIAQYAVAHSRTWYRGGPEEGTLLANEPERFFMVVAEGEPAA